VEPCLIGGHNDDIVSGVNHPGFKFGWTISNDSMHATLRHRFHTTGPLEQRQPYQEWVKSLDRYEIEL
jgi:hypothetical protein